MGSTGGYQNGRQIREGRRGAQPADECHTSQLFGDQQLQRPGEGEKLRGASRRAKKTRLRDIDVCLRDFLVMYLCADRRCPAVHFFYLLLQRHTIGVIWVLVAVFAHVEPRSNIAI